EAVDALAALFEYQKKYDESIALYVGLVHHGSATAYLQDRIGSLHLLAGRYRDAIRELEEGQRLDPDDTRGLLALAQAYEGAGDTAVALAAYDRLIQREPGNLEARFHRARLVQHEGDPGAALESFRSILDLASGRGALTEREETVLSLTHSQIGLIDLESRDFDGAAAAFDKSIESSHDAGPELYLLLGRAHLEKGRMQEALSAVAAGRERYPDDLDLRVFEGEVSVARGDLDEARTYYKTLLKSQKRSPEAYQAISEALLRHKRFEDAEAILKEGTRLHPASDALTFARGAALERLGRLGEAERLLSKAIHLNPKNAAALNYLGYMLADRGMRLKDSLAYVERALAIEPKNAAYLDSLGWAQFRLALYEPAERNLREAARYDPADPAIREHLGDLLMATGRPEEAIKEWRTALARGHEEPDKVQAKIDRAGAARKADR
ncbi:MAG TPA: tetratricopeptide repeat protein, partial [Candidatus Polarisedimenticolia bacterium]|nr:tetratricopeptide repeat protein [Candidatus Polarisedimenticolia bacterium]